MKKRLLSLFVCCILVFSVSLSSFKKDAYAIALVDDAAYVVFAILVAAAGITLLGDVDSDYFKSVADDFIDKFNYGPLLKVLIAKYAVDGLIRIGSDLIDDVKAFFSDLYTYFNPDTYVPPTIDGLPAGAVKISPDVLKGSYNSFGDYVLDVNSITVYRVHAGVYVLDYQIYIGGIGSSRRASLNPDLPISGSYYIGETGYAYLAITPEWPTYVGFVGINSSGERFFDWFLAGEYIVPPDSVISPTVDIPSLPADVPADIYVNGLWDDAIAKGNDIVINPPADIADVIGGKWDDAYGTDTETGWITGIIDVPLNPDLPIDPPIDPPAEGEGVSGLLGWIGDLINKIIELLRKILDAIKNIGVAISTAIIGTGTLNFDKFKGINLANVFPFCIPFDIIRLFKSFGAAPEAPSFEFDFSGTVFSPAGSMVLDLSGFEQAASAIRFFTFLSFALGLMLVTRNLIKG